MDMEQMMARLLAEIRTNRAKIDANLKEIIEEMRAWRKETRPAKKLGSSV
jgi:hypothetical protein